MVTEGKQSSQSGVFERFWIWLVRDFFGIIREMRWSYVPPLMVYFAAGISGFTGIIESFYVKEELGLSATFLAGLGFWAGIPWALKMPMGHLVDLFWRQKALFVYFGALLMALSLLIMVGLTGFKEQMEQFFTAEIWYIVATLLSPVGFVIQDVVADAMTVEAVPIYEASGEPIEETKLKSMHITMQTLGRIAIIGGSATVAGLGGWLAKTISYQTMYEVALIIPIISVLGVTLGQLNLRSRKLPETLDAPAETNGILSSPPILESEPNYQILGGSAVFVLLAIVSGLSDFSFNKEVIFLGSLAIITYLMHSLLKELNPQRRREIVGIAVIVFVFRAMPSIGAGASWWQIDVLKFDEAFFGTLRQISSILAIVGLFALRSWMTKRPIPYLVIFLSLYSTVMMLPFIGMYYGLHLWTEAYLGFGAHAIAIIDTMADSPLNQVAMVPMLAWIAREAPASQKATYFAVMAAFTNLALSASNLLTSYYNRIFVIERNDFSELGLLMIAVSITGLVVPPFTVLLVSAWQARSNTDDNQ
jgi:MFS family permease